MKQFGFTTDIEMRSPHTGNVYMIDRMTSDWAEAHPFDVDAYIEQVYQKYQTAAQESPQQAAWAATREQLRKMWDDVLGDMNPRGNEKLYPNRDGRQQPALMEVWLKAGDYWRRGLRRGDTIPAMVPSFKITRISSDGNAIERYSAADKPGTAWISLGDKSKHLLNDVINPHHSEASEAANVAPDLKHLCNDAANDAAPAAAGALDSARGQVPGRKQTSANKPARGQVPGSQQTRGNAPARDLSPGIKQLELFEEEQEESAGRKLMRSAGYLAAATLAIIIVWQTGLIIPLGLIGLATSGLLR